MTLSHPLSSSNINSRNILRRSFFNRALMLCHSNGNVAYLAQFPTVLHAWGSRPSVAWDEN